MIWDNLLWFSVGDKLEADRETPDCHTRQVSEAQTQSIDPVQGCSTYFTQSLKVHFGGENLSPANTKVC